MPTFPIPPNFDMHYEVDDYTDPWRPPATVLMLHGNAESGAAWYGWVPHLAPWISLSALVASVGLFTAVGIRGFLRRAID